jgi:lipopolysaccharide biosynthesis protein
LGYLFGCKIHTKKSLQLDSGAAWRRNLLECLLPGTNEIEKITERFSNMPALGLLVSEPFFFDLREPAKHFGNTQWLNLLLARISEEQMIGNYDFRFPAGSMFWFRIAALPQLLDEEFASIAEFELEAGQLNGTLAHAIERIVGLIPLHNQFAVDVLESKNFDSADMS